MLNSSMGVLPPYTLKDKIGEAFVKINPYEKYQVALESANVSPMIGSVELESIHSRQSDMETSRRQQRRSRKEPESGKSRAPAAGKSSVVVKGSQDLLTQPKGHSPSPMNGGVSTRLRSAKGTKYVQVDDVDAPLHNQLDSEMSRKLASINSGSIKRPIPQSNFYLNAMQLKHLQE